MALRGPSIGGYDLMLWFIGWVFLAAGLITLLFAAMLWVLNKLGLL